MIQLATEPRRWTVRLAALGGVVGPLLFTSLVVVGGVIYDGYSHAGQKISELGAVGAPFAWLQNLNFVIVGVLVIGFAWALAQVNGQPYGGPISVAIFGASSFIANGLLPCDAFCEEVTTIGQLHNMTGLTGFIAGIVAMFILRRRWNDDPNWRPHARFTRIAALVAIAGLVAFVVGESTGTAESFDGITQRIFVGTLLVWIGTTAIHLNRQISRLERNGRTDMVKDA